MLAKILGNMVSVVPNVDVGRYGVNAYVDEESCL